MTRITKLTQEEVEKSYEFKLITKILKKEFSWVKNVYLDVPGLEKYETMFLEIQVDYEIFNQLFETTLRPSVVYYLNSNQKYESPFLHLIFEIDRDFGKELAEELESTIKSIKKSKALPEELKLRRPTWNIAVFFVKD